MVRARCSRNSHRPQGAVSSTVSSAALNQQPRSVQASEVTEGLEGSANVVKAASVAWRRLTHVAESWFCELDWVVDGIRE